MDAVRVLFGVLCLAFAGSSGVFNSGIVRYGGVRESALVAGAGTAEKRAAVVAFAKDREVLRDAGAIVRAAQKEVGVREAGENTGARVDEYNAYVGQYKVAWCASFVSWCHGQAGYNEPRTAWSPALFVSGRIGKGQIKYAPSRLGREGGGLGMVSSQTGPQLRNAPRSVGAIPSLASEERSPVSGLVLGIYYSKLGRIGHCGIVEYVRGDWVHSIEGNTNFLGSREGDGVYRKIRHWRTIAKFASWLRPNS